MARDFMEASPTRRVAVILPLLLAGAARPAAGWTAPWPAPAKRLFSSSPEPPAECSSAAQAEAAALEAEERRAAAQEQAVQRLLRSTLGLDRGALASPADASRVDAAVGALEAIASCRLEGETLIDALEGTSWRLVYTSSLVDLTQKGSSESILGLQSMNMNLLVDVPALQPPVGLGAVRQVYRATEERVRLEDIVHLRLPALWPLPRMELITTFSYALEPAAGPGVLSATLEDISVDTEPAMNLADRRVTIPSPRRLLQRVLGQNAKLPPPLASLPPARELEKLEEGVGQLVCTAIFQRGSTHVLVLRSALGDLRVFVAESMSSNVGAAAAELERPEPARERSDSVAQAPADVSSPGVPTAAATAIGTTAGIVSSSADEDNSDTETVDQDSTLAEADEVEIWVEGVSDWDLDDAAGVR